MEAAFRPCGKAAFDLDGPESLAAAEFEDQVDLRPCRRAVKTGPRSFRRGGEERLDDESFPAGAHHGVPHEVIAILDAEESMDKAAVADIGLGRFHQAFADIGMERREASH